VETSAEIRIFGELRITCCFHKALDETIFAIVIRFHPGMKSQHAWLSVGHFGVERGPTEDLSPIPSQPPDMLRMAWMGERVVKHRVVQAPLVVGGC